MSGRRPEETSLVLSLRDDLWQMRERVDQQADGSPAPGERTMTPAQHFREWLTSPDFALYDDETGAYLGQAIPFDLEPSGVLEHRCAERLWRVNATIQGDLLDVDAPTVRS